MGRITPLPAPSLSGKRLDKRVYIAIWRPGRGWLPAGVITFNEVMGYSGFSYFQDYVDANEPPLNPATLNYRDAGRRHFPVDLHKNPEGLDRTFWELLPTTGDFASQVIISQFPEYRQLNKLHQLYRLGSRTVGGLSSYSNEQQDEFSIDSLDWLDAVRDEAVRFHLSEIMRLKQTKAVWSMVSYGGVRPKATFKDDDGKYWIAKFNLPSDPYDMAKAEALSLRLSGDAGLIVPETKVLTLNSGESVFLIERFDRKAEERFHGLSLYALAPGIDRPKNLTQARQEGATAMAIMMRNFSDFKDMDTLYLMKKLMMDLAINNTDNHLRNVRVILDESDRWALSPMFDMFFNAKAQPHVVSPAGVSQELSFLDSPEALRNMGAQFQIEQEQVKIEAQKVRNAVAGWEKRADELDISSYDRAKIRRAITLGTQGPEAAAQLDVKSQTRPIVLPLAEHRPAKIEPTLADLKPRPPKINQ